MPSFLPHVDPAQHAHHVINLAKIIAPSVIVPVTTGLGITVGWDIWDYFRKKAETAGRVGAEVVQEQVDEVQAISRVSRLTGLGEIDFSYFGSLPESDWIDIRRAGNLEEEILQEAVWNPEVLTELEATQIEEVLVSFPFCVIADKLLNLLDRSTSVSRARTAFRARATFTARATFKARARAATI